MFIKFTRFFLTLLFLSASINVQAQQIEPQININSICKNNLDENIDHIINRQEWSRATWGIFVKSLQSGEVIYSLNRDKFFIPASNVKLLITAASLLKLGADYSIATPIYIKGKPPNLTSLTVVGRGDPSLKTEDLQELVNQLKKQGIISIDELRVDDTYFPEFAINPSWEWSDLVTYYAPSVNSLMLNENAVTLTILPNKIGKYVQLKWSDEIAARQWQIDNQAITVEKETPYNISIHELLGKPTLAIRGELALDNEPDIWGLAILDPASYFLEFLQRLLLSEGIKIKKAKLINSQDDTFEIANNFMVINSDKLSNLITEINQNSNNLFAEALLKIMQLESKNNDIVKDILTDLGVNPDSYMLADGSGLSRQNLVTPEALTETLRLMIKTDNGEIYQKSLAVTGVSGTLENRFQDTNLVEKIQGKTGTITGVSALSGYLQRQDSESLVFSIIVNNSIQSGKNQRQTIDEIVTLLSKLKDNCLND